MTCTDCTRHATHPSWRQCDPACLECGGRYLRLIQQLRIPADDKRERLRAALKVWTDLGHSEMDLRRLAKGGKRETSGKG